MNNQPPFDRSLWIPIGVGLFALIGICIIIVAGRVTALRANVQEVPTATAFKYALVGTEPAITTLTIEPTGFAPPAATEEPIIFFTSTNSSLSTPVLLSPNVTNVSTNIVVRTNTPKRTPLVTAPSASTLTTVTRTPTSQSPDILRAATYDDTDYRIIYNGNWTAQSGVSGVENNTLHVSGTVGDSITFRFYGNEIHIFYEVGPSLGNIKVSIDGNDYAPQPQNSTPTARFEWVLPSVDTGTHTAVITHVSGGSVNFDAVWIPAVNTP